MPDARVNRLRYVAVAVPDFAAECEFLTHTWGLEQVAGDGNTTYFGSTASTQPFIYRVRQDKDRRLDLMALGAESASAVDELAARLAAAGVTLLGQPAKLDGPGGGYGFRFFDPDGRTVEISSDVAKRAARALAPRESIPAGLAHFVMHTPDVARSVAFYEKLLGFRVSDWLGDAFCFLRCNEWHHSIAFLPGPPAINHIAFGMRDLNEVMRGVGRLLEKGLQIAWGPGRHTAGNNVFAYFPAPSGLIVEYTAEVEKIDEGTWVPTVYERAPDISDQWGTGLLLGDRERMGKPVPDPGCFVAPPK